MDVTPLPCSESAGAFRFIHLNFSGLDGNGQMTPGCIDAYSLLHKSERHWGAFLFVCIAKVEQGACNESEQEFSWTKV